MIWASTKTSITPLVTEIFPVTKRKAPQDLWIELLMSAVYALATT